MQTSENKVHIAFIIIIMLGLCLMPMIAERNSYLIVPPDSEEYQLIQNLRDELSNSPQNWNVVGFNIDENINTVHCYKEKGLQHKNKNIAVCAIDRVLDSLIGKEIHIIINHKTFKVRTNMDKEISNTIQNIITEQEEKDKKDKIEKEKTIIRKNLSF